MSKFLIDKDTHLDQDKNKSVMNKSNKISISDEMNQNVNSDHSVSSSRLFKRGSDFGYKYIKDFDMENEPKEEKQFKIYIRKMTEQCIQTSQNKVKFSKVCSSQPNIIEFDGMTEDYENGVVQEFEDSPRIKLNTLIKSDSIQNYGQEDKVIRKLEKWSSWSINSNGSPFGPRIHSNNEIEQKYYDTEHFSINTFKWNSWVSTPKEDELTENDKINIFIPKSVERKIKKKKK